MIIKIFYAINMCFYVYSLMIFVRCLLTWIPGINWNNPILRCLKESVDIYLDLFKKFIPPVGMFDISPMVAFFALMILNVVVVKLLALILIICGVNFV